MYKRNIVAGLFGLILVATFLAILCIWLKAAPLIIICAGVMGLAAWDFFTAVKDIAEARES